MVGGSPSPALVAVDAAGAACVRTEFLGRNDLASRPTEPVCRMPPASPGATCLVFFSTISTVALGDVIQGQARSALLRGPAPRGSCGAHQKDAAQMGVSASFFSLTTSALNCCTMVLGCESTTMQETLLLFLSLAGICSFAGEQSKRLSPSPSLRKHDGSFFE